METTNFRNSINPNISNSQVGHNITNNDLDSLKLQDMQVNNYIKQLFFFINIQSREHIP